MTPQENTKLQMDLEKVKDLLFKKSNLTWGQYKFCERILNKAQQALDEETTQKVIESR